MGVGLIGVGCLRIPRRSIAGSPVPLPEVVAGVRGTDLVGVPAIECKLIGCLWGVSILETVVYGDVTQRRFVQVKKFLP